jgi:hypothetical protein
MPKVKAAVLERSRRSTAGKRMSSLVGKAQEDDDTFWSHSIWSESGGGFSSGRKRRRDDDDSSSSSSSSGSDSDSASSDGEGSFRMSDEESAAAEDQFDSDFDESESDDEEEGGEGATERELIAEERRQKASQRKKRQQVAFQGKGSLGGGRDLMGKKKKGAMTKRGPTGEGWNAGLVLNWPPPSTELGQAVTKMTATVQQSQQVTATISSGPVVPVASVLPQQSPSKPQHAEVKQPLPSSATDAAADSKTKQQISPIITKSKSKITTKEHNLRASASSKKATRRGPAAATTTTTNIEKKSTSDIKPQFSQEELIIEAIKSTETENAKWLSARKRVREEAAHLENAMAKAKTVTHNPVSRFYSRRGCTNTLTFMDMDHLPDILTRAQPPRKTSFGDSTTIRSPRKRRAGSTASQESSSSPDTVEKEQTKCVITGKIARYRDPKTMLGYYDLDAFKELRRRLDAGELPKQEKKKKKVPTKKSTSSRNVQIVESTMIAKLSSTGGDVKVKVKVGNDFVPPPPAEKEKTKQSSLNTQNRPRWDDASDNMYAKAYSSSKKQRTDPRTSRNVEKNVTSESNTSSQSKEAAQQNGNHTSTKDVALKPSISSSAPLPLPSSSVAAPVAEQSADRMTVTSPSEAPPAVLNSNGQTSSSPKKNIAELKPSPAELNTFMQTWISRPENKDNLMPSLQQKQKIMDEIGVDKKRLEGWFYRTRKKMKQDNPSDKTTSQPNSNAGMKEGDKMDVPTEAVQSSTKNQEGGLEVSPCKPEPATSTKIDQSNSQSTNGAKITVSSVDKSSVVNPAAKSTSSDDAQIPLLPSNGNKKCEQPSNIQDMIKQSEIQT